MHVDVHVSYNFLANPSRTSDHNLPVVRRRCCRKLFHIFIFSKNSGPISTKLGAKHSWVMKIQVCSNEGPHPFPSDYKIAKFQKFPPEPLSQFQSNLAQMHPWMKGIQFFSYEGHRHFPRGDNFEIVKIHRRNLKIFSRTTGPFSTKLSSKSSLGEENSSLFK